MERVAVPMWDSNVLRARNLPTSDTQTVTELGLAVLTMLKSTVDAAIAPRRSPSDGVGHPRGAALPTGHALQTSRQQQPHGISVLFAKDGL